MVGIDMAYFLLSIITRVKLLALETLAPNICLDPIDIASSHF